MSQATLLTIPAGDWLQAFGGIIGAGLAVGAALFIEARGRNAGEELVKARTKEVVQNLNAAVDAIVAGIPGDSTVFANLEHSLRVQEAIRIAIDDYRFVREDAKPRTLDLWRSLRKLDRILDEKEPVLQKERRNVIEHGNHDAVYQINRREVTNAALAIQEFMSDAVRLTK